MTLGHYRCRIIFPTREYSRDCGTDGVIILPQRRWQPLRPVLVLERWQVELELQLAWERLELWQSGCGVSLLSLFLPDYLLGEFSFDNKLLCHPPSICPVLFSFSEISVNFLSLIAFNSQIVWINIFIVSIFLTAIFIYGNFSPLERKLA